MPDDTRLADPGRPGESIPMSGSLSQQAKALEAWVEAAAEKSAQLYTEIRADRDLLDDPQPGSATGLVGASSGLSRQGDPADPGAHIRAALFGGNTALPGQGSRAGFELMLALMASLAAISYRVIRRLTA
jgi:hypothetical protein